MEPEKRYIYEIYKQGSFSKAAEVLFMTQPAISIAVKKIEASLGMPLFDRSHHPLQLTAAGEAYIEMIRKTQYLEDELSQQVSDIRDLTTGNILIGGSHYLNAYILPDILTQYSQKYPGIQISLVENSSAELAKMLERREIDLTFNCDNRFLQNFERYPAFYDHILLAVPQQIPVSEKMLSLAFTARDIVAERHLAPNCPTVLLSKFQDLEFVLLDEGNNLYERSLCLFSEAGFEPKVKMVLSQLVTAFHLAESGFAATFISDRLVTNTFSTLRFFNLCSEQVKRLFYILLPQRTYTSFAVRQFITHFKNAITNSRIADGN